MALQELSAQGIALVVDNYGTGYSSLTYRKNFPVDALKIDQAFVQGLPHSSDDVTIIKAPLNMTVNLMGLTAEGVELEEQLAFPWAHNCPYWQGYFVGRALPAEVPPAFVQDFGI